jgi:hypothetical protein
MRRLFHRAAVQTNAAPDEAVFETIRTAYTSTVERKSAQQESSIWRVIMKSPFTKLAVAAVVIIACGIGLSFWRTTGSGIVLADVPARIEQVSAYRWQWSMTETGADPNRPYSSETRGTKLISQEYGHKAKMETLDPNGKWVPSGEIYILPPKKIQVIIYHDTKKYRRLELDEGFFERLQDAGGPREMARRFLGFQYENLGRSIVDGVAVEGFRTTDPNFMGGNQRPKTDARMWVDVKTQLPVRYDFTYVYLDQVGNRNRSQRFVMHDFQWGVPVQASEFEPVIPDGYTSMTVKYPARVTEETAIQGLRLIVELLGKYPENINFAFPIEIKVLRLALEKSETPAAMRWKEQIKGLTDEEMNNKLADFLTPIRGLAEFYLSLGWGRKDPAYYPAYYGKTVTPKDADKVLVRWKVSDKEYRVIFGDLHAETVSPEKLAELEKNLPK